MAASFFGFFAGVDDVATLHGLTLAVATDVDLTLHLDTVSSDQLTVGILNGARTTGRIGVVVESDVTSADGMTDTEIRSASRSVVASIAEASNA